MPDTNDIINAPEWLPHDYDAAGDRVLFIRLPLEERQKLTFLAEAPVGDASNTQWIAGDQLRSAKFDDVPVHFIFHSAFCRSTLLVRAFDALPGYSGLSEPKILNTLATAPMGERAKSLLPIIVRLLGRPFEGGATVVVKPSNVANSLIPALMGCDARSKGIILYGNLRSFLHSVAKKGLQGRIWGRRLMAHNGKHIPLNLGLDGAAQFELSDMQAAAVAWLLHQWQFGQAISQLPARLCSLDSDQFIAQKLATLKAAAQLFGTAISNDELRAVTEGVLFTTHAKLGGDFNTTIADQERKATSEILDEEIGQVAHWIEVIQGQMNFTLPHKSPLIE